MRREGSMREIHLALWGPSASGKTVLLAQLYNSKSGTGGWDIYPTQESLPFVEQMQARLQSENRFPPFTTVGHADNLLYEFVNRETGAHGSLQVEDRAGRESEELNAESQQRLNAADGLVLLFDPTRDPQVLRLEVQRTLQRLHVAGKRKTEKDPRPIAVCLSKADLLIRTAEDARRATEEPDAFVRERMVADLGGWIDHFCSNYRLFPVSAAGIRVRRGVVEPVVFFDEQLQPRIRPDGQPINLAEPFLWVFEQVEKA
jgi:GTPase SAR1 family protein